MDSAGIGNWGVFGQLVTVVAAALAAVYIIIDNVRRTTDDNESPVELPAAVTVFYPPRRGGIFGRAFQRGRPYFGSRSPLRSIWELGVERPLAAQEAKSCQSQVTEIVNILDERSASFSSDDSVDSPPNMEPVRFGNYRHDDGSISSLAPPDRYLSDTAEKIWEAMEPHGSDVREISARCVEDSHARLQRLLQRDMERQAKVRTYQLWTSDGEKVKETVKLGMDWLKDADTGCDKFDVEVRVEKDKQTPVLPDRNGSTSAKVSIEVSSAPRCAVHEVNVSARYTPPRPFTPKRTRTKYQEFSMPQKQDEDEEDCRQIPLLSNGDESCLRAVDDTISRKKKEAVGSSGTVKDAGQTFKIASVLAWETPKPQKAETVMSPNGIHPDNQRDASRSPKKDERRDRTSKPPIPPSSLPFPHQFESSKALFRARQQFFENLSRRSEATSPDCTAKLRKFQQSTRQERYRLATSTPDLKILEETVRVSFSKPVPVVASVERRQPPAPPPRAWPHHAHLTKQTRRHSKSAGYLETDIDTMESRTVLETNFDQPERFQSMHTLRPKRKESEAESSARARSVDQLTPDTHTNQLGRAKSEYEIRVEKSLQNLSVPDWYKQSKWSHTNKDGFILKKKRDKGWQDVRSRKGTLSMTNLNRGHGEAKRVLRSADESPTSSTGSLSRWSSAKLSTASGPVFSWSGTYRTGRQPYLGWRASLTQSPTSSNQSIGSTPTSPDPGSCESSSKKILKYLGQEVQVVGSLEDVTEVADKCELEEDPKSPGSHSDHLSIPRDRYSYMESIFNSDSCIPKRAQINQTDKQDSSKVVWIESSFVGSRATTSVAVMPDLEKKSPVQNGTGVEVNKKFYF